MNMFKTVGDFFALDIGTTKVRVVQLKKNGAKWDLVRYGSAPIDTKTASSHGDEDQKRLSTIVTSLITQTGITARNVVVGIPSDKTFATVVDLPALPEQEMQSSIKYQAEQYIPTPIDETKVDWAILGKSSQDEQKVEVLLASVSRKYSESRLELVESLGLNVIAIEPDSIALARSLVSAGSKQVKLIIDLGDLSTDIVVVAGEAPRLIRGVAVGLQTLVKAAAQNLNIDENQAYQFITKFGLYPDKLEGQIFKALETSIEQFVDEVDKSIKFFHSRYPGNKIDEIIISNHGLSIPAFGEYLAAKTNIKAVAGNTWTNVNYNQKQQNELLQSGPSFAVAVGLAERTQ